MRYAEISPSRDVMQSQDRSVFFHRALPVSFSYPSAFRRVGDSSTFVTFSGSGETLEVLLSQQTSGFSADAYLPAGTGSLTVIRSTVDGTHPAVFAVRGDGPAVLWVPLYPPRFVTGRRVTAVVLRGERSRIAALASTVAFEPEDIPRRRAFLR